MSGDIVVTDEWPEGDPDEGYQCVKPECEKPVWIHSGIHQLCWACYAEWYNGYAKAYGWEEMDPDRHVEPDTGDEFDG